MYATRKMGSNGMPMTLPPATYMAMKSPVRISMRRRAERSLPDRSNSVTGSASGASAVGIHWPPFHHHRPSGEKPLKVVRSMGAGAPPTIVLRPCSRSHPRTEVSQTCKTGNHVSTSWAMDAFHVCRHNLPGSPPRDGDLPAHVFGRHHPALP